MFKQTTTPEAIQVYELYVHRIMAHYELALSQFKMYFGVNAGLLVVIGFIVEPFITKDVSQVPRALFSVLLGLGLIGIVFSIAWLLVSHDGRRWQLLMNEVLGGIEEKIFEDHHLALYLRINKVYSPKAKLGADIIDINRYVPLVFVIVWLSLLITLRRLALV